MLFKMDRETEEDLECLVLKENLDFLFEDQRYDLLMLPFLEGRLTAGNVSKR